MTIPCRSFPKSRRTRARPFAPTWKAGHRGCRRARPAAALAGAGGPARAPAGPARAKGAAAREVPPLRPGPRHLLVPPRNVGPAQRVCRAPRRRRSDDHVDIVLDAATRCASRSARSAAGALAWRRPPKPRVAEGPGPRAPRSEFTAMRCAARRRGQRVVSQFLMNGGIVTVRRQHLPSSEALFTRGGDSGPALDPCSPAVRSTLVASDSARAGARFAISASAEGASRIFPSNRHAV